jgi:hypothetical protein
MTDILAAITALDVFARSRDMDDLDAALAALTSAARDVSARGADHLLACTGRMGDAALRQRVIVAGNVTMWLKRVPGALGAVQELLHALQYVHTVCTYVAGCRAPVSPQAVQMGARMAYHKFTSMHTLVPSTRSAFMWALAALPALPNAPEAAVAEAAALANVLAATNAVLLRAINEHSV